MGVLGIFVLNGFVIGLLGSALGLALGVLITLAALGAMAIHFGSLAGDLGPIPTYLAAGLFVWVGLHLVQVLPIPLPAPAQIRMKRKGALAAFVLGLVFWLVLGPCTFAFMVPVIVAAAAASARGAVSFAAALMGLYALGHCGVITLAGAWQLVGFAVSARVATTGSLVPLVAGLIVSTLVGTCLIMLSLQRDSPRVSAAVGAALLVIAIPALRAAYRHWMTVDLA